MIVFLYSSNFASFLSVMDPDLLRVGRVNRDIIIINSFFDNLLYVIRRKFT